MFTINLFERVKEIVFYFHKVFLASPKTAVLWCKNIHLHSSYTLLLQRLSYLFCFHTSHDYKKMRWTLNVNNKLLR